MIENQLEELCSILNEEPVPLLGEHQPNSLFKGSVGNALDEMFTHGRRYSNTPRVLRVSSLGKPVVDQMLPLLIGNDHPMLVEEEFMFRQAMAIFTGHFIEAYAVKVAQEFALDIHSMQFTVDYKDVVGHIDFIIDGYVVDVKSMSDGYYSSFSRKPNNDRGYITQASVYSEALGLPFAWLLFNSAKRIWSVKYLSSYDKKEALDRVDRVLPKMRSCVTLNELLAKFKAPEPLAEVYRKEETGKFILPPSMFFSNYKHIWYEILDGINLYNKKQSYVIKRRTANEVIQLLSS